MVEGSAPGRLDLLGGVADYSGALVLEVPIEARTTVGLAPQTGSTWELTSTVRTAAELPGDAIAAAARAPDPAAATRDVLARLDAPAWVSYPVGCLVLVAARTGWPLPTGLRVSVRSDVPDSVGMSSSAALEVATIRAALTLAELELDPLGVAGLAQAAEHRVVGAPCGLMDQLTVALGVDGALLPILCRPGQVLEPVRLPAGVTVVGWPSGHRRAVRAQPYTQARVAAFIGRALAERELDTTVAHTSELDLPDDSPVWDRVPETLTGDEALQWGVELADPLSAIEPGVTYQVRAALSFAVREHQRTTAAHQALLHLDGARESQLREVGRLMRASHDGYGTMGLGSAPTDRIVEVLDAVGPEGGVYGSRVSGGGSGGTVVVLATTDAIECLPDLARRAGLPPPELARISQAR